MRKLTCYCLIGALLVGPAASLRAQEASLYRPDSVWAVDYGEDYCRLMRDFSNGKDTVGLFIERVQPGPLMRLHVIGDSIALFRGADQIGYHLLPSGSQRMVQRLRLKTADGQQLLSLGSSTLADAPTRAPGSPPPPYTREGEQALAKTITGLELNRGPTKPVRIETGALDAPIAALQACADELLTHWGLDAEKHRSLSRPALPATNPSGWLAAGTIPFGDFAKLSGGNNEFRVMTDAAGKPTACHVHWPTLDQALNDRICATLLEKGQFTAALDQAGEPTASYWMTSAFFLMPPPGGR